MAYEITANAKTPALVIYLIDVSGSMKEPIDGASKIDLVNAALMGVLKKMIRRSTKSTVVSPRYRVGMIAYSTQPQDILGGIRTITEVAQLGAPQLKPTHLTDAHSAFEMAREMLRAELPRLDGHPAPMVCHLTDGVFTGADPEPVAREIMQMRTSDGHVLVENIYVGNALTRSPITDPMSWTGVQTEAELANEYAAKMFRMSSPIPQRYATFLAEEDGYSLLPGAAMLFPANCRALIELAFAMSGATPTT